MARKRGWDKDTRAVGAEYGLQPQDEALLIALDRVESCLLATMNLLTGTRHIIEKGLVEKYGGPFTYQNPAVLGEGFIPVKAGRGRRNADPVGWYHAQAAAASRVRYRVADAEAEPEREGMARRARNRATPAKRHGGRGTASHPRKRSRKGGV